MAQRLELQALLLDLLGSDDVYFQPPPTVTMQYPCIVYNREFVDIAHADNMPYKNKKRYQITVIDRDPDSDIPDKVAQLPRCGYDRNFMADGLNHDVFHLYF